VAGIALKTEKNEQLQHASSWKKKVGLMDGNISVIIAVNSARPFDSSYLMRFIKIFIHPAGFAEVSSLLNGVHFGK
jgi:hypothetical protein